MTEQNIPNPPQNDNRIDQLEILLTSASIWERGDKYRAARWLAHFIAELSDDAYLDLIAYLRRLVQFGGAR